MYAKPMIKVITFSLTKSTAGSGTKVKKYGGRKKRGATKI